MVVLGLEVAAPSAAGGVVIATDGGLAGGALWGGGALGADA
jgi:hypothetical protein